MEEYSRVTGVDFTSTMNLYMVLVGMGRSEKVKNLELENLDFTGIQETWCL